MCSNQRLGPGRPESTTAATVLARKCQRIASVVKLLLNVIEVRAQNLSAVSDGPRWQGTANMVSSNRSAPSVLAAPRAKKREALRACDYCRARKGESGACVIAATAAADLPALTAYLTPARCMSRAGVGHFCALVSHFTLAGDGASKEDRLCTACTENKLACTYLHGSVGRVLPPIG